ncbi:MAG: hypothetical protein LCH96_00225 [Actinobacteria bacterium]|nr:hypothetical protein [Actinomycetota bacterium]
MSTPSWPPAGPPGPTPGLSPFDTATSNLTPPPPAREARTLSGGRIALILILVLLVAGAGMYYTSVVPWLDAIPGQCVAWEKDRMRVVDCSAPDSWQVVGVVEVAHKPASTMNPCNNRARVSHWFWQGESDGSGRVYCLRRQ